MTTKLFSRIDHVGIAVRSLDEALPLWRDKLGLPSKHVEVVESQGVRVAMLPVGESKVELLEPTRPDSPIAKFLEKRGPGIHHVAFGVADCAAALDACRKADLPLVDERPRRGAMGALVAFLHPKGTQGVLTELVERP